MGLVMLLEPEQRVEDFCFPFLKKFEKMGLTGRIGFFRVG